MSDGEPFNYIDSWCWKIESYLWTFTIRGVAIVKTAHGWTTIRFCELTCKLPKFWLLIRQIRDAPDSSFYNLAGTRICQISDEMSILNWNQNQIVECTFHCIHCTTFLS